MKQYFKKKPLLFLVILTFCISAITIPVSAHFAQAVISISNHIRAADYQLDVTIMKEGETTPTDFTNGKELDAGTYTVKLEKTGTAMKGFCLVEIEGKTYYTDETEFTITLDAEAKVTFTPHWGEATNFHAQESSWTEFSNTLIETTTESSSAGEPTTVVNSES